MIVVGDIAAPDLHCSQELGQNFRRYQEIFSRNATVCNFEGLICDNISLQTNTPVLFNHSSVIEALRAGNVKVAALANNHTLDLPSCFDRTAKTLGDNGILICGAGRSKMAAEREVCFVENGVEIVLINLCWDFLLYHQHNPTQDVHVAGIDPAGLPKRVKQVRSAKPEARIVIYLHWSFDLETLPFPMYRKLSMNLIDAGANIVVGTHSHCVQGGERYRSGFIVYGLGNFFLPNNTFANGRLTFPDFSRLQMALEWEPVSNMATCHWFEYQNQGGHHILELKESAPFEASKLLKQCSPYDGTFEQYISHFRSHRRKKILIPIYLDPEATWKNGVFTRFLKIRGRLARSLAKMKIRKWQS
jgi:poly-gamma-glutamate synthesis protein (capsule biosynthesis protein)